MCERAGELNCPFVNKDEDARYTCELPSSPGELTKEQINQFCLRPHCRKCPHYQEFEEQKFPLFNPKNRKLKGS
jgi:hypothetical protein